MRLHEQLKCKMCCVIKFKGIISSEKKLFPTKFIIFIFVDDIL